MAQVIALTNWRGEFTEEYAAQPPADPARFGMPTDDDGSRDDPLLSGTANGITSFRFGTVNPMFDFIDVNTRRHQYRGVVGAKGKVAALTKAVGGVQNITEENMPEAHIRGDINTQYKCIGAAIVTMQNAGFQRVGFISEPPPNSAAAG